MLSDHSVSFSNPSLVSFVVAVACDVVFIAYFSSRRRAKTERQRWARLSIVGIVLQGVAWGLIGNLYRLPTEPLVPMPAAAEIGLALFGAALAIGSIWLCIAAVSTLGKQWTYVAEVGEGHQLVMRGPYARVRHPIYVGMTGLVIASALAIDKWWALPIVIALQLAGTLIRIREEDRLLCMTHGPTFAAYAAKVPAILPRWIGHGAVDQTT